LSTGYPILRTMRTFLDEFSMPDLMETIDATTQRIAEARASAFGQLTKPRLRCRGGGMG
jgi:hypothetical protein